MPGYAICETRSGMLTSAGLVYPASPLIQNNQLKGRLQGVCLSVSFDPDPLLGLKRLSLCEPHLLHV